MKKLFKFTSGILGQGRLFKFLFNISPMYRRTGGRLITVSDDLKFVKIKIPLNYKTRNYVGSIYGGHMYSCVDGIYMVQLINILGNKYVVWDKSAQIRFRKPAKRTLFAEFLIKNELVEEIINEINLHKEKDFTLHVNLIDAKGVVYAQIEKVIYIASKEHYLQRKALRKAAS